MGESSKGSNQRQDQDQGQDRVLAYDGDCGLCRVAMVGLHRLRLVPRERLRTIQSFDGELAQRLVVSGVHDELAVWDPGSDEIRTGSDGLLWALEESWVSPVLPLFRIAPVRAGLRVLYRLVAYNRRILSPPKPGLRCACDPSYHPKYRSALIVIALSAATASTLASVHIAAQAGGRAASWDPPFGLLVGALAIGASALALRGEERVNFLGHQGLATFWSQLVLMLAVLAAQPMGDPRLLTLAAVLAAVVFGYSMVRRFAVQGLGGGWRLAGLALFITGWCSAIFLG